MSALDMRGELASAVLLVACACAGCDADPSTQAPAGDASAARTGDGTRDGATSGARDGGDDGVRDSGGGDRAQGAEPRVGDPLRLVGTFAIELVEADASSGTGALSSMRGFVRDAPVNERIAWEPVDEVGGCVLETPSFPFCEPDCAQGRACVADDVCLDDPVAVDVGLVTVTGVETRTGATEFQLTRIGPAYQPEGNLDLSYPPAAEGAVVRLRAEGGDVAPFEVNTHGIAPLELAAPDGLTARPQTPLSISWTPPDSDKSAISVLVDLSHHGGSRGRIVCDVEDTAGALEVDAALISALIDLGTAGFPTLKLTRRAVGSTVVEFGRVDFSIEQGREIPLQVPGLVSCSESSECPDGQSCLPTRKCG